MIAVFQVFCLFILGFVLSGFIVGIAKLWYEVWHY
jgi:hypothetical protein